MKTVHLSEVMDRIKNLVQTANFELQDDVLSVIKDIESGEESPAGKAVLKQIEKNADIAREERLGLCQDTGLAVFFVELGEDVRFDRDAGLGSLKEAITEGARAGYEAGYADAEAKAQEQAKQTGAPVSVIQRDEHGRPKAVVQEFADGRVVTKTLEHDADGRIVRVVESSAD